VLHRLKGDATWKSSLQTKPKTAGKERRKGKMNNVIALEAGENMTDYQLRTILRMVLGLVRGKKSVEEIEKEIMALLEDSEKKGTNEGI
jgi:hypothetical protein